MIVDAAVEPSLRTGLRAIAGNAARLSGGPFFGLHSPMRLLVAVAAVTTMGCCGDARSAVPDDARKVIRSVHEAASKRDFTAVRSLMVDDFQWSFGGDRDAGQAIDAWKADPRALDALARVTSRDCGVVTTDTIECPRGAGTRARAGFLRTSGGWRMHYFVEGD